MPVRQYVASMRRFTGNTFAGSGAGLAVLCVAQFVIVLDLTIVATALPAIGAELDFPAAQLAWVLTAYTVVLAGLLILGGRIADLAGARRMFGIGLCVFTAASVGCALAWSPAALVAARVVQGAGAALLSPAALAALNGLVEQPEARRRALGWWTAAAAGGGASGWMLGGVLVQFAGWRWIFAINAPIGLAALLASRRALARVGRDGPAPSGLDLAGATTVTGGIASATLGLSWLAEAPGHWGGWAALAAAIVLLAGFVRHERRTREPLLPGSLLQTPGVMGGNLTATALTASTTPAMLTVVLYVYDTLRLAPAAGSLLFPAFNLAVVAGSLFGPQLILRFRTRAVLLGGFGGVLAGACVLFALPSRGLPVGTLLTSFALMGAGLGAASVASTTAGTAQVAGRDRGVASGLLNSTAQLGSAVGLAITTPLVVAVGPMGGYRLGFATAAAVAAAGTLAAFGVPRGAPPASDQASRSAGAGPGRRGAAW
jgi:MFS family permease